jgi:hypothetical protein
VGFWDVVVPVTSVVVTGGVAMWSKIIDARSKREDRRHARVLDYEGRVWQAKNDALRRLISACRLVKRRIRTAQTPDATQEDYDGWRTTVIIALRDFQNEIGGEEGVSEITAYASEPVREAVDDFLSRTHAQFRPYWVPIAQYKETNTKMDTLQKALRAGNSGDAGDTRARLDKVYETHSSLISKLGAIPLDLNRLDAECDHLITVSRNDLQGRY